MVFTKIFKFTFCRILARKKDGSSVRGCYLTSCISNKEIRYSNNEIVLKLVDIFWKKSPLEEMLWGNSLLIRITFLHMPTQEAGGFLTPGL